MSSSLRRPLLVAVPLCAWAVLAAAPPLPSHGQPVDGPDAAVSAEVARLYRDAAVATQRYEQGRREADARRALAVRAEALLDGQRRRLGVLHEDLGRIARAQYRTGGSLPMTARLLLADHPERLISEQHAFARTQATVSRAIDRSRRAQARLVADEAKAAADWRALEKRTTALAALRKDIEAKLEDARGRLQGQADAAVAAGSCRGAVRLDQPPADGTRAWVAPVETYRLSAGFGSDGSHWAHRHTGQDFAVPIGTPVRAVGAGRVVRVACGGAFGIEIVVGHPGGYYTQYAHLAAVAVEPGQRVVPGQWIGQSGTSGNSTGPHLHFEVRITPDMGSALDPLPWLAERGVPVG
ncbi:peptidase M23 [Streptomyces sp. Ru71]|uniref:M23 family metallopeptidase n=1 Tax=Streptomyces sp. Ru71 TaxID=2080746 RepID=UPI000CDD50B8|nr:M23 family metallopeptidase [Streptomyces sp. Ru71]POX51196.1 peptidase M23 [Streptomyces sp. Ru71]